MPWIYKYGWFESKRHSVSHTDMYFHTPSKGLDNCYFIDMIKEGLAKIEYIWVEEDSVYYKTAVESSALEQ